MAEGETTISVGVNALIAFVACVVAAGAVAFAVSSNRGPAYLPDVPGVSRYCDSCRRGCPYCRTGSLGTVKSATAVPAK